MSQPLIMSFRPDAAEMCLDGRKTMTRRIVNASEIWRDMMTGDVATIERYNTKDNKCVTRWRVGKPITIKASRTSKGLGKVMCIGLRVEHVQDITEEDARREGMTVLPLQTEEDHSAWWTNGNRHEGYRTASLAFMATWKRLYPTGPKSWEANPLVVVIEFEPVGNEEYLL